jgi:hypothetical protein
MLVIRALRANPLRSAMLLALAFVALRAGLDGRDLRANFAGMDNDDILRLVMVRDFIAGQSWFDTTQYRLLPPSGVVIHWSRYIDLGIALVIMPLARVMPMAQAEQWATVIWPMLILTAHLGLFAFATARLFGVTAACFALLIAVCWPVTGYIHASIGNLDHHNVQMLMMSIVALALIWPDRGFGVAVLAGIAAAFSLAIGLETLPFVIAAGVIALTQFLAQGDRRHGMFLAGFAVTLGIAAGVLFLGQTAPALRGALWCDRLALPVLAVICVAVSASLAACLARPWGLLAGLVCTVGVTLAGLVIIWPLLGSCLAGPYGDLPQTLQTHIATRITEARPAHQFLRESPAAFIVIALPVIACVIGAMAQARKDAACRVLWLLCALGLAMMLYQMRSVIMAGAVVPVLGGVILAQALRYYKRQRSAFAGLRLLTLGVALGGPAIIAQPVASLTSHATVQQGTCRDDRALAALDDLPLAVFVTPFDLGPAVLWASGHAVVSAGYHVDPALLGNAITPFAQDAPATMLAYLRQSGASHLLLCAAATYDGAAANDLATGGVIDGLAPVAIDAGDLRVFRILPQ